LGEEEDKEKEKGVNDRQKRLVTRGGEVARGSWRRFIRVGQRGSVDQGRPAKLSASLLTLEAFKQASKRASSLGKPAEKREKRQKRSTQQGRMGEEKQIRES